MLKRLYNEMRFVLTITTTGPVLVRSGHPTLSGPDMTPVLTYRHSDWQVYLPGSSLKGVMRSHSEKVCRTLRPDPPVVCNPFVMLKDKVSENEGHLECPDYADVSCGDKFERRSKESFTVHGHTWRHQEDNISTETAYADSCPVCRLFGSTEFIGRVSINDAYLADGARPRPTETRDGVGIDRLTGGSAHGALFNLETVSSNVVFRTDVHLRNFECWQVGMILLVVQDMADGLVRIGSGRSRGMGSVSATIDSLTVGYIGLNSSKPPNEVWGLGKFLDTPNSYGTQPSDIMTLPAPLPEHDNGLRRHSMFDSEHLVDLRDQAIQSFATRLSTWLTPAGMTFDALQYHR